MNIKSTVKSSPILWRCYTKLTRLLGRNRISVSRGNNIELSCAIVKRCYIRVHGIGNRLILRGGGNTLINSTIQVFGNNSTIILGGNVLLRGSSLWMEDDGGCIVIGENTKIFERSHLASIEGRKVSVGRDCLISSNVYAATGDGHSLIDQQGQRINPSKDVAIGDHVWIGQGVTLMKGVTISRDSIVGGNSVVTKPVEEPNVAIVGNPARIARRNVNWDKDRI